MDISQIDKNFQFAEVGDDVEWHDVLSEPVSLHGVYYEESEGRFRRLPNEVAKNVNDGVQYLSTNTAGGRARFVTDSPYVAVRAVLPFCWFMSHLTVQGQTGFSVYDGDRYLKTVAPDYRQFTNPIENKTCCQARVDRAASSGVITVFFPLYNGVHRLLIGIKKGSSFQAAPSYTYEKPVLFYGSSITQGGCASHPGNDYIGLLSRWLDTDVLNLGFSGSARGEKTMSDYLCSFDPSVFVLDYDHNAPNSEHLAQTHYPLYAAFREKHPTTPIVFVSRPDFYPCVEDSVKRRSVVMETYRRALSSGDTAVEFVDGESFFASEDLQACTVDCCHPNDLGFYLMAKRMYPVLKKYLKR